MPPLHRTVKELLENGKEVQRRTIENCHLHFNGPGASGFGVKRTAMLLPQSVMLLVAPGCCGRHGTIAGKKTGFDERMFYLRIDERDLVTGNYQKRIPEAAKMICDKIHPKALFLCMTCVDALLGSDLEGIGKKVQSLCHVPVVSSFMDPITRESKRAPMVSVQQAIMQCLEKTELQENIVNLLGTFVPMDNDSDLLNYLRLLGRTTVLQISACNTFAEYMEMAKASLNIVLHPQAEYSARYMEKKLGMPYVMLSQCIGLSRINEEYKRLENSLGSKIDISSEEQRAKQKWSNFLQKHSSLRVGIGEAVNGNPLEIALSFLEQGVDVPFVFRNILQQYDYPLLDKLVKIAPELPVFSGVHPSILEGSLPPSDVIIGLDAAFFQTNSGSVNWSMEYQTFGYHASIRLLEKIEEALVSPIPHKDQLHGSYLVV